MPETLDYPHDAFVGPRPPGPDGLDAPVPQPYAFQPGPVPAQRFPPAKPNRLTKAAALVGLLAGSLVIVAVLFGGGFYLGRATAPAPQARTDRSAGSLEQSGPMIIPMPRGQFQQQEPGITIPNGPTIELPNIFPQMPMPSQEPSTQVPGQPPR